MNKYETIKSIETELKRKVIAYEEVQDNEIFKILLNNTSAFIDNHYLTENGNQLLCQCFQIITIVDFRKGSKVKLHNCITFILPDESLIRFSPYGNNVIELTRIWVKSENQRKGQGSYLMNLFFRFIQDILGYIPTIFLECTGEVGIGENALPMDISEQTRFFRNWDFRVNNWKEYPHYVSMIFNANKIYTS